MIRVPLLLAVDSATETGPLTVRAGHVFGAAIGQRPVLLGYAKKMKGIFPIRRKLPHRFAVRLGLRYPTGGDVTTTFTSSGEVGFSGADGAAMEGNLPLSPMWSRPVPMASTSFLAAIRIRANSSPTR
jgi:hypothetical protein